MMIIKARKENGEIVFTENWVSVWENIIGLEMSGSGGGTT